VVCGFGVALRRIDLRNAKRGGEKAQSRALALKAGPVGVRVDTEQATSHGPVSNYLFINTIYLF
jgi:hypothetical protein